MNELQELAYTDINEIRRNAMETITLCHKLIINYQESESTENLETANQIINDCFRILAATQDAYEYNKLDGYAPQVFNLYQFLEDVVSACRSVLRRTKIKIIFECEENLCVNTDPERLLACLLALITNSAQHMDSEIAEGEIEIKATRLAEAASISVQDNGYGMDGSEPDDIFDYSKNKGGLAVVKKFCDVAGSTFITGNLPYGGFMVSFRLPLAESGGPEMRSSQPIAPISLFSLYNIYLSKLYDAIVQFSI